MPPSRANLTGSYLALDTQGREYLTTLPQNAFCGGSTLHPDGAIDVSYPTTWTSTGSRATAGVTL